MNQNLLNKILIYFFTFLFVITVAKGFYVIYLAKDFDYTVEAPCDQNSEKCFVRDCSNPDDCPPNQLETYKEYTIKAKDFGRCSDNSCENICNSESNTCTPIECGDDPSDSCVGTIQQ